MDSTADGETHSSVSPASAATFKWANDGDANSMDPYTRSETFLLTFTQNLYDPLVRRDRSLKVEPQRWWLFDPPADTAAMIGDGGAVAAVGGGQRLASESVAILSLA